MIQHHKSNPYHSQSNGIVEGFNKILEHDLIMVFSTDYDDFKENIPSIL